MASFPLALPGILFVGEDERARLLAHLGPAAGWMIPKGILQWSTEVSVVAREALNEQIRRDAKIVMPEEQIPPAKMPLAHQSALKSPLVGVSSRLTQKLVDGGIRVHTVGADRVTSSFYYIAEGGGEDPIRIEGDLVAAVGAMLGERADNAAIERVLDGLVDRLLRSLSKGRVNELALELAAALPRAAADGSGTQGVDLESFEKEVTGLVGTSEKYTAFLQEIANKIGDTNERRVEIPLFGDARKVSQGPFELMMGDRKVALVTHERWLASGPFTEPKEVARPASAAVPQKSSALPITTSKAPAPKPEPKPAAAAAVSAPPANMRPLAAPLTPPRPASNPPPAPAAAQVEKPNVEAASVPAPAKEPTTSSVAPASKAEEPPPKKVEELAPKEEPPPKKAEALAPKAEEAPKRRLEEPSSKAAIVKNEPSAREVEPRSARLATSEEGPRKEKGIPWLWILVALAAMLAAYRLFFKH